MSARFQTGVTAEANRDAIFLTLNQSGVADAAARIRGLLRSVPQLERDYRIHYPDADLHLLVAVGSGYWTALLGEERPAELSPFPALENAALVAPSTPVDLLFHIRSERHDLNFRIGRELLATLGDAVELVEEVHGFRYLDSRDLTGFVDGTENPSGEHRAEVALVGAADPRFAGGSYIHLQRYVHDLPHWNREPLQVQEDSIGRTKRDNVEYPGEAKALTAHTRRTSLKDGRGRTIEILRHSMPYGNMRECGLMFASFCRTPRNFALMLQSMIEGDGQGHTDHLLRYTRAVTGQAFFAPAVDFLESLE